MKPIKEKICECGEPFTPHRTTDKFCSYLCTVTYGNKMKDKICPICKEGFKPKNTFQKICSHKCNAELMNKQAKEKKARAKEAGIESLPDLRNKAIEVFNKYIRLKHTDDNGNGYCYTSGLPLKYGTEVCQAGHCFSAGSFPQLRFNENNVRLQSLSDNYFKAGNVKVFKQKLLNEIGADAFNDLAQQAGKQGFKEDRAEYINVIKIYTAKIKELENRKVKV